MPGFILTGGSC